VVNPSVAHVRKPPIYFTQHGFLASWGFIQQVKMLGYGLKHTSSQGGSYILTQGSFALRWPTSWLATVTWIFHHWWQVNFIGKWLSQYVSVSGAKLSCCQIHRASILGKSHADPCPKLWIWGPFLQLFVNKKCAELPGACQHYLTAYSLENLMPVSCPHLWCGCEAFQLLVPEGLFNNS